MICVSSGFVFVLLCITLYPFYVCNYLEKRKRKLVALLFLPIRCIVTINILRLFLTVPWVGWQCAIVVCPYQTHFTCTAFLFFAVILQQLVINVLLGKPS